MNTPHLNKKFAEVVKSVEVAPDGTHVVTLFEPYEIKPDPNLQISCAAEGAGRYTVPKKHFRESLDTVTRPATKEVVLRNEFCSLILRWSDNSSSLPGFTFRDLTDVNEETCFNRSFRGIGHVLCALQREWKSTTKFNDLLGVVNQFPINTHLYCARD